LTNNDEDESTKFSIKNSELQEKQLEMSEKTLDVYTQLYKSNNYHNVIISKKEIHSLEKTLLDYELKLATYKEGTKEYRLFCKAIQKIQKDISELEATCCNLNDHLNG